MRVIAVVRVVAGCDTALLAERRPMGRTMLRRVVVGKAVQHLRNQEAHAQQDGEQKTPDTRVTQRVHGGKIIRLAGAVLAVTSFRMATDSPAWRRLHFLASALVALVGIVHVARTPFLYRHWTPEALWSVGTGLGLLGLGAVNIALLRAGPSWDEAARVIRWTNYAFALFSIAAVIVVPDAEEFAMVGALLVEAVASRWTLPGPA